MVSFRGQKKLGPRPGSVSFRGVIQNCRRASPPLSYAESPPPPMGWRPSENRNGNCVTDWKMNSWSHIQYDIMTLYQTIPDDPPRITWYSVRSKFYSRSLNSVEITKEQRSQSHVSRDQESPLRKGLIYIHLSDQFRLLGNCKPTPPLSHHFVLSKK